MIDELIASGRFEDALRLLKEPHNETQAYQKILCLYSLKRLSEARLECELLKEYAEKNYYDVIAIYVTILIEMQLIDEAKEVLEEELSMPYIPGKYEKIFNETYDELLKKGKEDSNSINIFDTISDEDLSHQLLFSEEKEITLMLLEQLEQRNIRRLLPALKEFLKNPDKERIFKTIIIESLANQNVNEKFEVVDKDGSFVVVPSECVPVMELNSIHKVMDIIEKELGNQDVSFLQYCGEVLMGYIGNIYPNDIEANQYSLIACAIIFYVDSLLSSNISSSLSLEEKYNLNDEEINNMIEKLEKMTFL